jgi:hypothetical protein
VNLEKTQFKKETAKESANSNFVRTIASTLLFLCVLGSASFAVKKPISHPRGLAVDAKGNLYVANSPGRNPN